MAANPRGAQARAASEGMKFGGGECSGDRDHAVVQDERAPAKQGSREGQELIGEWVTFEVLKSDGAAGGGAHGGQQFNYFGVGEVMQEE